MNTTKASILKNKPTSFLPVIFLTTAVLLFVGCSGSKKEKESVTETQPPNIIFLLADDQRSTTINVLGNKEVITPNLGKLVNEGTTFNNTYGCDERCRLRTK